MEKWKHIWQLQVPDKLSMFLWRLAHNSLPTRMNIKRKKIELDTRCPMCSRLDEDSGHLSLKCKKVKAVWGSKDFEAVRLQLCECAGSHNLMHQVCSLPVEKKMRVTVLLWDWWTTRNKTNTGEKQKTAEEASMLIINICWNSQA